jgi:hypothetical protein
MLYEIVRKKSATVSSVFSTNLLNVAFRRHLVVSASRPPEWFCCLNDKMIKELMSFAKYEIGKLSYNYIEIIR